MCLGLWLFEFEFEIYVEHIPSHAQVIKFIGVGVVDKVIGVECD